MEIFRTAQAYHVFENLAADKISGDNDDDVDDANNQEDKDDEDAVEREQ